MPTLIYQINEFFDTESCSRSCQLLQEEPENEEVKIMVSFHVQDILSYEIEKS
jgi:hypothetical protein